MGADDLIRWRAEFPILERSVYMISNSLGAMPRGAAESLAEYAPLARSAATDRDQTRKQ